MTVTYMNKPKMSLICETLERIFAARGTPIKLTYELKDEYKNCENGDDQPQEAEKAVLFEK